jgi:hypothetical protein
MEHTSTLNQSMVYDQQRAAMLEKDGGCARHNTPLRTLNSYTDSRKEMGLMNMIAGGYPLRTAA